MYLLDTSVCVQIIRARDLPIAEKLKALDPSLLFISSIVLAELCAGVEKASDRLRASSRLEILTRQFPVVPFDDRAARKYGEVRAYLELKGSAIGANDMLIAATAISEGLTLITLDSDFDRVLGLSVLKW